MKAEVDKDGYLRIEVGAIVEALPDASLRAFAKTAVFQEHLLRGVIDALVHGQMWVDDEEPPWWFGGDFFNDLRLKLAPLLPTITMMAVAHLEAEMRRARREMKFYQDACWKLLREWPEGERPMNPVTYEHRMNKEEATAYLRAIETKIAEGTTR